MKFKDRIKSAGFWTGLIGSVFLMLGAFGVDIGDDTAQAAVNAVCSALVVFGIITVPKSGTAVGGGEDTDEGDMSDGGTACDGMYDGGSGDGDNEKADRE